MQAWRSSCWLRETIHHFGEMVEQIPSNKSESVVKGTNGDTYFDSSTHPPPTRTITVLDLRILQKHNFALPSNPIQYCPDKSCHSELLPKMPWFTGRIGISIWK